MPSLLARVGQLSLLAKLWSDLEDEAARVLASVDERQLVVEWKLLERAWDQEDKVERLDLGRDEVDVLRRLVVLDGQLAVLWVDDQLSLEWHAALQRGANLSAGANPPHVDSHVAEHLHVHAATAT